MTTMAKTPIVDRFGFIQDQIFNPRIQTIFKAVDRITPALKAANRMEAVMDTSFMRAAQAITPVNPIMGRV